MSPTTFITTLAKDAGKTVCFVYLRILVPQFSPLGRGTPSLDPKKPVYPEYAGDSDRVDGADWRIWFQRVTHGFHSGLPSLLPPLLTCNAIALEHGAGRGW